MAPVVGVLALQGAFREHARMFRKLRADVREVRLPAQLDGLDGLAIPGGESTTMGKLLEEFGLCEPLSRFATRRPVFATCAGLIVLAQSVVGRSRQPLLKMLDVEVERNGFGRQVHSFESPVELQPPLGLQGELFPGVFIRAPRIFPLGTRARVVAGLNGEPVGVLQGNLLATSFHPELSGDLRLHAFFLDHMVCGEGNIDRQTEVDAVTSSMTR
ncbi:MAG: pyridoxal 5'-phosphate synthase glutaminase subunit PdxT [Gaiellales bacterium]|nr:pyridoxal 5'-phosphate synthase glutaminase subunit PdxT [Gaiellales bacterium]